MMHTGAGGAGSGPGLARAPHAGRGPLGQTDERGVPLLRQPARSERERVRSVEIDVRASSHRRTPLFHLSAG